METIHLEYSMGKILNIDLDPEDLDNDWFPDQAI